MASHCVAMWSRLPWPIGASDDVARAVRLSVGTRALQRKANERASPCMCGGCPSPWRRRTPQEPCLHGSDAIAGPFTSPACTVLEFVVSPRAALVMPPRRGLRTTIRAIGVGVGEDEGLEVRVDSFEEEPCSAQRRRRLMRGDGLGPRAAWRG
jgi:hypothetical protein